jgi:formamidopyrimidine-DNA glycosylase
VPELPEAETIVRDIRERATGARVAGVRVPRADILASGLTPSRLNAALTGRSIEDVQRRGKNVVLVFEGEVRLVINLGMTGRVIGSDAPRAGELRHIAAALDL